MNTAAVVVDGRPAIVVPAFIVECARRSIAGYCWPRRRPLRQFRL